MKVYRLCRKLEVEQILNNESFNEVGNFCRNSERNSHNYDESIKYLHFFKQKTDLLYLNTLSGRFICTYDIPEELLSKHYGVGSYRDYIRFVYLNQVEEYAIPSRLLNFDYIQTIDEIVHDMDVEDFYKEDSTKKCVKRIYSKQPHPNQVTSQEQCFR